MAVAQKVLECAVSVSFNWINLCAAGVNTYYENINVAVVYGCGTMSSENCTYFENNSPVAGDCSHMVRMF